MSSFSFTPLDIPGAFLIDSFFCEDNRGSFIKIFEKDIFREHGIEFDCNEYFISHSSNFVIRGMHFQLYHPQTKLVSVIAGKVFDVIVDLRKESPLFGKWQGFYLSKENHLSLLIPKGCAHGFLSLCSDSIVCYKCDGKYDKKSDSGIFCFDADIGIDWPINNMAEAVIGVRDKRLMSFKYFKENCSFMY